MKKGLRHIWCFGILLMSFAGFGQSYSISNSALNVGNPGGLRTVGDFTTTGGTSVLNGGTGSTTVNYWSDAEAIPFNFNFYGSPVTHFIVSKNGLVSFDTTNANSPVGSSLNVNTALPNTSLPNNTITAFWEDTSSTSISTSDHVYTYTYGSAPNRQFWIHYYSFEVGTQSYCYWAIVLEEGTDKIYIVDMNYAGSPASYTGTVGIQVDDTTAFEASIPLNGVSGSPNIAMGTDGSSEVNNEYYEFAYLAPGACIPSTAPGVTAITSSSADVYWTPGSGTNFLVEYGPTGFVLGSGTQVYVSNDTTTLSALSANTTYDFYVKDSCTTNSSMWVGPVSFTTPCAGTLNGTYTINSALPTGGTNFNSFAEAAAELNACGITGPVTMNVVQGSYTGQFVIDSIPGISSSNTVTIQAAPSNTSPAELSYTASGSADNYVLKFNGAEYVTVRGLTLTAMGTTYGYVIDFEGNCENLTIEDNILNGGVTSTTSSNMTVVYNSSSSADNISDITIQNNQINNGSYAFYWWGSSSSYEGGNSIDSNTIDGFYYMGIYSYYQHNNTFNGNTVTQTSTGQYSTGYGIRNYYGDSSEVIGNNVVLHATSSNYGIYNYYCDGSASSPNLVANNMVACIGNTGTTYGIYVYNNYYTDIIYNSVLVDAGSTTAGRAIYLNSSTSGTYGNINVQNNNVVNTGGGYAFEVSSGAVTLGYVSSSDNNNLYATGSTLARVNNSNYADLSTYQTAVTTFDQNSVSADPLFFGPTDLHVNNPALNAAAAPYAGITMDIDGDMRNATTPDIGADEFAPPSCFPSSNFMTVNVWADSATVSWSAGTGVTYQVEYDTTGFTQGMGTQITALADTFVTITGLMANTTYDFYVRDVCGANDTSIWSGPGMFTTLCVAFTAPYTETFDGTTDPACWNQYTTSGGPWEYSGSTNSVNCAAAPDHTGNSGNYAWMDQSGTDASVVLEMNDVDVSGLATAGLEFYYWMCGSGYSPINATVVEAWNGTSWDVVDSITTATSGWERMVYDISSFTYGSGLVRIRFRAESGGSSSDFYGDNAIDDVTIDDYTTLFCAQPFMAPYFESFDNTTMPLCWSQSAASGGPWSFSGSTNSVNCSAAPDHTGNSGSYMWMDQSGSDDSVIVELHDVDVSGLTTPYLEFYYWMCGSGYTPTNSTVVQMWDGTNWVTWDSISVATSGWMKIADTILPSQTYNSGLVKVRFIAFSGGATLDYFGDNAIDDIHIIEAPSCLAPTNPGLIGASDSQATIYWTTGGASDWNIAVGTPGFNPSGSSFTSSANDTATITGLSSGTSYEAYVRDSCSAGDVSLWVGPIAFTTSLCDTATKCTYQAILRDSYGDAWNGGEITIYQNNVAVETIGYTPQFGGTNDTMMMVPVKLCDSLSTVVVLSAAGGFASEIGLEIISPATLSVGSYSPSFSTAQGDTLLAFNTSCALPACLPPTALGAFNITDSSAMVYFTPGGASNWNIQYGITGFTLGSGSMMTATNDTAMLSGLMGNTTYQFYVQDSCAVGNVSPWVGPFSFTTACGILTAPYSESFDNSSTPNCWSETGSESWNYSTSAAYGAAVAGDHTGNSGNYAWIDGSTPSGASQISTLITPLVDVSGLTSPELHFYLFSNNIDDAGNNTFIVEFYDGANWDTAYTNQSNLGAAWFEVGIDLTTYTITGPVQARFTVIENSTGSAFYNDILIDDVEFRQKPTCPAPSGLNIIGASHTAATIYWTGGGATDYNISLGTPGFNPSNGTISSSTNDTITLTGLSTGTNYEVYVRDSCSAGDVSAWVGPLAFGTTPCDTANRCTHVVKMSDSFGDGWNGSQVSVYQGGVVVAVVGSSFTTGDTAFASIGLCDSLDAYFVITTGSNGAPNYSDEIGIEVFDSYNRSKAFYDNSATATQGDTIAMFTADCSAPSCLPPGSVGITAVTTTSMDVYWTSASTPLATIVEYGPVGFTPGTGTKVSTTNDTITLSGLTNSTKYTVCLYDSCGVGNVSSTVCFLVSTACTPITSYPYTQGFESSFPLLNSAGLPACFTATATASNGVYNWYPNSGGTTSGLTGPTADHTLGNINGVYVYTEASSPAATGDTAIMELREFNMTSLTSPELVFWYHMYGADIQNLNLEVWNTTTMSWDSIYGIGGQQQTGNTDPWLEARVNMAAYTSATNLRLRFLTVRGASFNGDVALDDITMREVPPCVDPTGLAVTNVSLTSIGLSWNSDTTVGSSVVQYGPTGFTLGSGTIVASTAGSATIGSLTSSTCYDFYVLDSCGSGFTSWVGPINGCTSAPCTVTGTPLGVMGDTTGCGGGTVTLTTTSTGNVGWLNGSEVVGTGSSHIDSVNFTTTFNSVLYNNSGAYFHVGPTPTSLPGSFGNFTNGHWITVMDTLTIDSITVRANGYVKAQVVISDPDTSNGGRRIQLGEEFETDSNVTADKQVYVGALLTPGSYYVNVDFDASSVGALYRATNGAVFPYDIPGLVSVDSVNFNGGQIRYYYIFDMVVRGACLGTGVPAVAYVPGANAGSDAMASVCETNSNVNLASYLGIHDAGGTWSDDSTSGALTDSIFDASTAGPGTYGFTYYLMGTGGCAGDTSMVTITVGAAGDAGTDTAFVKCETAAPVQLKNYLTGSTVGTIDDLDGAGLLGGSLLDPGNTSPGVYRFRFRTPAGVCPSDTAMITVTIQSTADCGVSVEEEELTTSIQVFPNPSSGVFNILAKGAGIGKTELRVYSANGQLLLTESVDLSSETSLDLSHLADGMYSLVIETEAGMEVHQISKM